MQDSERTDKYQKSRVREAELRELNRQVATVEARLLRSAPLPQRPTVFIVGAPRSGTTLLAQLLAASGAFGYVTNFTARLWYAPILAMRLEKNLGLHDLFPPPAFSSDLGRSTSLTGVHEFGYFWQRWFSFDETHKLSPQAVAQIDRAGLQKEIGGMEAVWQQPLFFKNLTCGFQIEPLAEILPRALFVLNVRCPLFNTQSIYMARQKMYGNHTTWWSLRPPQYPMLLKRTVPEQIAGQIYYSLEDILCSGQKLKKSRFLVVEYSRICQDPRGVVERILAVAKELGSLPECTNWSHIPESFRCQNRPQLEEGKMQELKNAVVQYPFSELFEHEFLQENGLGSSEIHPGFLQ